MGQCGIEDKFHSAELHLLRRTSFVAVDRFLARNATRYQRVLLYSPFVIPSTHLAHSDETLALAAEQLAEGEPACGGCASLATSSERAFRMAIRFGSANNQALNVFVKSFILALSDSWFAYLVALGILRFFAFDAFRLRSLIAAMRLRRRSNSSALKFFGTPRASRPRD